MYSFGNSNLAYAKNDKGWNLINIEGILVFNFPQGYNPTLHHTESGSDSLNVVLNKDYKYGLIDNTGNQIVPPKYEKIETFNAFGLAKVELDGKTGFINAQGLQIIIPTLDTVSEFYDDGYARVGLEEIGGFYSIGIIDSTGRYIVKSTFKPQ